MTNRIDRREAIRRLSLFTASIATPALLASCKSKPSCNDVTGLTSDEINARNTTAAYVDCSPYPDKLCNNCAHYVPAAPNACGGCKVLKGPIAPEGYCKLWVAPT